MKLRKRMTARRESGKSGLSIFGPDVYDDLIKLNRFDLELFRRVESEVLRRFLLMPGFETELAEFNQRCARRPGLTRPSAARVPCATANAAG